MILLCAHGNVFGMAHEFLAAVDLGSNSFRLQIGRIVNDQIYLLDGLKESVRLAAGLSADKFLDEAAQQRGVDALRRFNERLRGFDPGSVRAVATNTLRVAKNAHTFLVRAEEALGFPIEIVAGREEARLIYVGVAHTIPDPDCQQLVVDIGGGSTECIIGRSFRPILLESLYMGCVGYSIRFFPDGRVNKLFLKEAELAASRELQTIAHAYRATGWENAVGSSGSAKMLSEILCQNHLADDGVLTRDGLEWLRNRIIKAGRVENLDIDGLRGDREPVLLGGFAIMSAVFKEFALEKMQFSEGALRQGVLYDLLGRYHHHDLRDATVEAFAERYQIDRHHAIRVARTACYLLGCFDPVLVEEDNMERRFLYWAAILHEIGISVAHTGYHKHSAYIIANADMPGFSHMDQARLARIVLVHRGKLARVADLPASSSDWRLIACLRLAVIFHRSREDDANPPVRIERGNGSFTLLSCRDWLEKRPLTSAALEEEQRQWLSVGKGLKIHMIET